MASVRVRIPVALDFAIVGIQAREHLSREAACIRLAALADQNGKQFEDAVQAKAQSLSKSTYMKQLNTARATIQKNEADAVRTKEDNFHVPCSKCGKPMSFSSREQNWSEVKVALCAAFKNWSHVNCPK